MVLFVMLSLTHCLLIVLLASVSALPNPDQYSVPAVGGGGGGGIIGGGIAGGLGGGIGSGGYGGDGPFSPAQYSYSYENVDGASGNQYGHGEERRGDTTQGEYRVLLPDGRTQIVKYYVNGGAGFVAEVTYEGNVNTGIGFGGGAGGGGGGGGSYVPPVSGGGGYGL